LVADQSQTREHEDEEGLVESELRIRRSEGGGVDPFEDRVPVRRGGDAREHADDGGNGERCDPAQRFDRLRAPVRGLRARWRRASTPTTAGMAIVAALRSGSIASRYRSRFSWRGVVGA